MGRSPCCDKIGLKKGPWTPEEDQKLLAYVEENGHGSWRALPVKAGLQRCGKSCRLRWTNYLRPDIKRGQFSLQEEQTIIQLHALLGNRWSAIATHLSKRTDNEIKNYWNTHLKKRLAKMGIDPVTHKPKKDTLLLSGSKNAANLSHMAQWENARLQAEARLVRQSKLRSESFQPHNSEFPSVSSPPHKPVGPNPDLDIWTGAGASFGASMAGICADLESPTSTVCSAAFAGEGGALREEIRGKDLKRLATSLRDGIENSIQFPAELNHETPFLAEWRSESMRGSNSEHVPCGNFVENFTDLLLSTSSAERRQSDDGGESDDSGGDYEGNKNYWDSILNLVNSSPSDSPIF